MRKSSDSFLSGLLRVRGFVGEYRGIVFKIPLYLKEMGLYKTIK
ncbi:hypothetical protein HMPREF1394_00602 [Helicobacter pylori GAM105Ai]|nr:hypothetical protein HMPREF1394_00602 [Helicobacter pylori GAM105Ai]